MAGPKARRHVERSVRMTVLGDAQRPRLNGVDRDARISKTLEHMNAAVHVRCRREFGVPTQTPLASAYLRLGHFIRMHGGDAFGVLHVSTILIDDVAVEAIGGFKRPLAVIFAVSTP